MWVVNSSIKRVVLLVSGCGKRDAAQRGTNQVGSCLLRQFVGDFCAIQKYRYIFVLRGIYNNVFIIDFNLSWTGWLTGPSIFCTQPSSKANIRARSTCVSAIYRVRALRPGALSRRSILLFPSWLFLFQLCVEKLKRKSTIKHSVLFSTLLNMRFAMLLCSKQYSSSVVLHTVEASTTFHTSSSPSILQSFRLEEGLI